MPLFSQPAFEEVQKQCMSLWQPKFSKNTQATADCHLTCQALSQHRYPSQVPSAQPDLTCPFPAGLNRLGQPCPALP